MTIRGKQRLQIWTITIMMLLGIFLPFGVSYADNISPTVLTNLTATVTQDGKSIASGGTLTSTKPIRVDISFGVPVVGDDPTPATPVHQGDTTQLQLSSAFSVLSGGGPIALNMGTTLVAHASFTTDSTTKMVTADVVFDGDTSVFDGRSNTVTCQFGSDFQYDASGDGGSTGDHTITILGTTYIVNVPPPPIIYNVTKTGTPDLADQSIAWTVNMSATQGGSPIDLAGYQFSDDLQAVGSYIPSSFQVDGVAATPDTAGNKLGYTFPSGSTSPKAITFKTKISNAAYYATSEQTVHNKAQLLDSTAAVMGEGQYDVKFTPQWIKKTGESSDSGSSGVYTPTGRTITWTITANQMGATLNNVVITDALPTGLTFQSAKWQAWNGSAWGAATDLSQPSDNKSYSIGNISSPILLTIVTGVPDALYTAVTTTYTNSASIRWDGLPVSEPGTGSINVPVGYNAITKSGVAHPSSQTVTWTVGVDTKGQSIPNLKVYDLLVYGSSSIDLSTVTGIPAGINTSDLTQRLGQKYAGNFSVTAGFGSAPDKVTVIPIMQGLTQVADLLEITDLSTTVANTFTFNSQVVDPNIYASNQTKTVSNTATMFSANTRLNAATGSVNYTNRMLNKQMLNRSAMSNPAAGVNTSATSNVQNGFDYKDKTVIFRLSVNEDGLDLTNMKNGAGQTLGDATVTDTLPAGWEFVTDPMPGQSLPYMIFIGTVGTVNAADTTPDTVSGLSANLSGGTATFTFTTLDKPYVILVKARPTDSTAAGYFSANKTTTVRNNATLNTVNWSGIPSVFQDVAITSQILNKTTTQPTAGELRWTVDYKPYNTSQPALRLEDQLPIGIDLRTDSSGVLVLSGGNITANEMSLNADGSYTVGNAVALTLGQNIFYNNGTRILRFNIPDNTKAYRFSYLTDVTGKPGTVTNKVSLLGSSSTEEQTSKPYVISSADGSASLQRNGWISIMKADGSGNPLAGAEFTLFATDDSTVIKKGVTGSDGIAQLKVIPDGTYILRETAAPAGYALEGVIHSLTVSTTGGTVTSSIDGKTGANANTVTVRDFSEGTAGNLTISKVVTGYGADTSKIFHFTLTLNGASGTYNYVGHGVPNGTIKSGDTVSLADGQNITITGLPKGTTYTVTEADYSGDGYASTSTGASGSIVADTTQTAAFTNTKIVGSLTITKTVAGNAGDTTKKFNFTLTLNGTANLSYPYTGNGVPDGTIKSGDTVSLANGQSITIAGLPNGTTYAVTEADYSGDGYSTNSTGATGSIAANTTQTAAFINTRNVDDGSGNLMIKKTVSGNLADRQRSFTFVVHLGTNNAYGYWGSKTGTIQNGSAITLKSGEFIVIESLPVGITYQVIEMEANQNGYITSSTGTFGIIKKSGQTAAFVNTKSSVPKTGDDNIDAIGCIGLTVSVPVLIALIGLNFVLRPRKPRRIR